jgi:thymidylate synthase (FAD)
MKIISSSHEILDMPDGAEILKKIETAGRTCYKSEDKITADSATGFVRGIIKSGHHSVIEHMNITVRFVCDRGVSHELVHHRLAAYSQESTRYANYSKDRFGNEITVIKPPWVNLPTGSYCITEANYIALNRVYGGNDGEDVLYPGDDFSANMEDLLWLTSLLGTEQCYFDLLSHGWKPEQARSVLPNSLKPEIVMTANLREWRHVLNLRCSKPAHSQIREIMLPLLEEFHNRIPVVFDDLYEKYFVTGETET